MISGELKTKIDKLWLTIHSAGVTVPHVVVTQITNLMFIRDLDDLDNRQEADSKLLGIPYVSKFSGTFNSLGTNWDKRDFKWSVFIDYSPEKQHKILSQGIFPFLRQTFSEEDSAYAKFMSDAKLEIDSPSFLSQILQQLDTIYDIIQKSGQKDVKGDVYEYVLMNMATSGINGQFRTPRQIIDMMVALTKPTSEDSICDPACGSAGFLNAAYEYIVENEGMEFLHNMDKKEFFENEMFIGLENDPIMMRIAVMNMITHGFDNPKLYKVHSLTDANGYRDKFSLILANPPFKGAIDDKSIISEDLLKLTDTSKSEILFVTLILKMLKVGGRAAVIVPDGVVSNTNDKVYTNLRKELVENHKLEAVISLHPQVFRPYAGVSASILIFTKVGKCATDYVWFYDMQNDGFSRDDKRVPIDENDIPDIIERFFDKENEMKRTREDRSFFVPKQEIVVNNYELGFNKYRKVQYVAPKYRPSKEILDDMVELSKQLTAELENLKKLY